MSIQWILYTKGVNKGLHYLDDFILVVGDSCTAEYHILLVKFEKLKVLTEQAKLEGPSTCLCCLGIEVDTISLQLHLPSSKLALLKETLAACICLRTMTKRDLQRLTGLLQFATKIVHPGRPFPRRLYAL